MEKIYEHIKELDKIISKCNYYKFKIYEKCIEKTDTNLNCKEYKNLMDKYCNKYKFLSN
jgi:hypothetical protein